jgi:hypothetical protein
MNDIHDDGHEDDGDVMMIMKMIMKMKAIVLIVFE